MFLYTMNNIHNHKCMHKKTFIKKRVGQYKENYSFFFVLAEFSLCCCAQAFSSCVERGLLFVVVRGLLIAVASLVAEHGL